MKQELRVQPVRRGRKAKLVHRVQLAQPEPQDLRDLWVQPDQPVHKARRARRGHKGHPAAQH